MKRSLSWHRAALLAGPLCALCLGCGTTKWSDSPRTATEQLLVSDAVDRAVSELDFGPLAGRDVYLDTRYIVTALDQNYVVSTLRQHMLASGCIIHDKAEDADYVVEVRSGALGTNRQDVLLGVPATNLPTAGMLPIGSAAIPEIALMKRTNQQAVCKLAVYAYDRMSGQPVWQSGNRKIASRAKDSWFLGAGPFQKGTIYDGTAFAGEKLNSPFSRKKNATAPPASVAVERSFPEAAPQYASPSPAPNGPTPAGTGRIASLPPTGTERPPAPAPAPTAPAAAPPAGGNQAPPADGGKDEPRKAAYTPPPPGAPPPAQPAPGLQGHLTPQTLQAQSNPAVTTAGAIQTYNLAKELLAGQE
ncbi:MAG: DUF6655 family protein, partial [Pirellulales bacterium]